jgi:hypothetical protein
MVVVDVVEVVVLVVVLVGVGGSCGAGQIMSMPQRWHSFHVFVRHLRYRAGRKPPQKLVTFVGQAA